jgi:hypothetical protein
MIRYERVKDIWRIFCDYFGKGVMLGPGNGRAFGAKALAVISLITVIHPPKHELRGRHKFNTATTE